MTIRFSNLGRSYLHSVYLMKVYCYGLTFDDHSRLARIGRAAELELFSQLGIWSQWRFGTCVGAGVNGAHPRRDLKEVPYFALAITRFCGWLE